MQLKHALFLFGATLALLGGRPAALAQSAAFTYQGRLNDSAGPATGIYDLRFTIYDAVENGGVAGGTLTNANTAVSNGLFTATLDFGAGVFSGANRWLEIGVRTNGSASDFTALAPRQPLTATPYAVRAANFSGAISDAQLSANIPLLSAGQLPDANLSTNLARLNASQTFTGTNTFAEAVRINGSKTLEFGAGVTKESNAGKIGYQTFTADTLDIVGAGTNGAARKIKFFAEGGATFNGNLSVGGHATISSNVIVGGNVSAPTFTGNGSGLTGLNATNVTGSLPDARLSTNVALRNGGNTFSGNQIFTVGNVGIGTANPTAPLEIFGAVFTAPETLDQQQPILNGYERGADHWQSFTAAQSGLLSRIELYARSPLGFSGPSPGTIRIYAGEGTGGTLLATESVTFYDPPQWHAFTFAMPAAVLAGSNYSMGLSVPSSPGPFWVGYNSTNPYAGGRFSSNPGWDCVFKTYVTPGTIGTVLAVRNGTVTATAFVGSGSGLSNINAANLTGSIPPEALTSVPAANLTGTIADAQLSGNVARLSGNQTFSGNVNFSSASNSFAGSFTGNGAGVTNVNLLTIDSQGAITFTTNFNGNFVPASSPVVGPQPSSVVAADVNGDFKVDLISANSGADALTVLTNNGSGGFVLASSPVLVGGPQSVVAADVNGDFKLDLISANYNASTFVSTLNVLTNNGSGGFALASSPDVGTNPRSVVAADVNGDFKLDLISANYGVGGAGNTLTVLTNNGSGGFVLASSPVVGNGPESVTAADVNGDGKVDLVSANYNGNTLTVLTNNGSGGFALASSPGVGVGTRPQSVVAADINGDGKLDLISANYNANNANTLTVLTNNGSGGFALASLPSVTNFAYSVVAADVNGDGKVDLISAHYFANALTVLTNNGSGGFVLASSPGVGSYPRSVTAADVNGDGGLDLISANSGASTLTVLFNTPTTFTGAFSGDGSGLTSLNAANLTGSIPPAALTSVPAENLAGTIADARLSTNVALRSGGNTFSGDQVIPSGRVGIGTSPSAPLDVRGDGSSVKIRANSVGASSFIELNNSASVRALIGADGTGFSGTPNQFTIATWSSHPMKFFINQTERMMINTNGNVGIGTNNPASALHVNGTVTATAYSALGSGTFEFGAGVTNKESNAGKIGYETFTPGALDIVGAGTTVSARKIKFFAEGGATFNGNVTVGGHATISSNTMVGGNLTVGAFSIIAASTNSPAAASTLTPTTGFVKLTPAAAVTLNGTTAIASAATPGTTLILQGTSIANTVTINDGANTRLVSSRTLGLDDTLTLIWNGSAWVELSFAKNN